MRVACCATPAIARSLTCASARRNSSPSATSHPRHFAGHLPALSCKLATPNTSPPMPAPLLPDRAAELQRLLAELTGHAAAHVRPYGKHLLIQMRRDDALDTVARLTETARHHYTAA